jgi:hypothetical protein
LAAGFALYSIKPNGFHLQTLKDIVKRSRLGRERQLKEPYYAKWFEDL